MGKSRTHDLWKPIMDAAFHGHLARIEQLLDAGADPNIVSKTMHRYRPLHRAIESKKILPRAERHEEVVKLLLARGADPQLRGTMENVTPLALAAIGETRFVSILRKHVGLLDIFHAAALGDLARVKQLLAKDPALAISKDENGWTALHYAAASKLHHGDSKIAQNLVEITRLLLKAGANPSAPFLFGGDWPLRPLYYACGRSNNPAVAELLIQSGADPCDGESVYHASDEGHDECLAVLSGTPIRDDSPMSVRCVYVIRCTGVACAGCRGSWRTGPIPPGSAPIGSATRSRKHKNGTSTRE